MMDGSKDGAPVIGIILAAGRGQRMRSRQPKPLHRVAGKELVRYPAELMAECGVNRIAVVVSPDSRDAIAGALGEGGEGDGGGIVYAVQEYPDGTAGAVVAGLAALVAGYESDVGADTPAVVLVMAGDTPLVRAESVRRLLAEHAAGGPGRRMTILSATDVFADDLGQIERAGDGVVVAIVEAAERAGAGDAGGGFGGLPRPAEVNTGVYCFDAGWLGEMLPRIGPAASGERYLTALAGMAAAGGSGGAGGPDGDDDGGGNADGDGGDDGGDDGGEDGDTDGDAVVAVPVALADEAMGVNDRRQLAAVETVMRDRINERWMLGGVTILDTATTYIDAGATVGVDTVILPNTMIGGDTAIGAECEIGPNAVIRDSVVGDGCRVTGSALEGARVGRGVSIGPYCHLRAGAVIEDGAHLGNYVEVKNSRVGANTAAGHFCYLGDADIGAGVNIGAGAITCNYDGRDKHPTTIGDGAFIGSDTMLIAPVAVGAGAATGAGSVVTKDIPDAGRAVGVPARLLPASSKPAPSKPASSGPPSSTSPPLATEQE